MATGLIVAMSLAIMAQAELPTTIGVASQEADGTIVLQLSIDERGARGDALYRYRPGDRDYDRVKKHVGPIAKNGTVTVKPFPKRW